MTPLSLYIFIESRCHSRTRMGQEKTASHRHSSQCQLHLLHSFVIIGGNGGEHTGCFYKEPYSTNTHLCSQRDSLAHWHPSEESLVLGPELVHSSSGNRLNTPLAVGMPWRGIHPYLKGRRETACYIQLCRFSKLCQLDNSGKEVTEVSNPSSAPLHRRLSFCFIFVLNDCLLLFSILCCLV